MLQKWDKLLTVYTTKEECSSKVFNFPLHVLEHLEILFFFLFVILFKLRDDLGECSDNYKINSSSTCLKEQFTGFRTLSQEQVRMLISRATGKSCQLDPIPTPIVLKLLDVLLPVITKLINLSFDTGRFAEAWKEALVLPSLKKPGLDFAFKNFRPVSNLSYISKLSERAGAEQFLEHLTANNLHSQLQHIC